MNRPVGFSSSLPTAVRSLQQRRQQQQSLEEVKQQLPPEQQAILEESPHIGQVFACGRDFIRLPQFTQDNRIIYSIESAPKTPYTRRTSEIKTVIHSGQRKLLVAEIEFLTRYAQPGDVVVYAGAAPGTHQRELQRMFPFLIFVLYDPEKFMVEPIDFDGDRGIGGREIYQEFFTDQTAESLAKRFRDYRVLFMSDIRRYEETLPDDEKERVIQEDMTAQLIWVSIINPVAFMLKLRPRYGPGLTTYFAGLIHPQPWAGITSSETRLHGTDRYSDQSFDNQDYENVLFYYNTITRTTYFDQIEGAPLTKSRCHCYDCAAELFILGQYLSRFGPDYVSDMGTTAEDISDYFGRLYAYD
jgi:hypothetical protein